MRVLPVALSGTFLFVTFLFGAGCGSGSAPVDGAAVFQERCAVCHGSQGQGAMGPALSGQATEDVVREGRLDLGMPAFESELSDEEIEAVVGYANTLNR